MKPPNLKHLTVTLVCLTVASLVLLQRNLKSRSIVKAPVTPVADSVNPFFAHRLDLDTYVMLHELVKSGELQKVAREVSLSAESLPHDFPIIDLTNVTFVTLTGQILNTRQTIQQLQQLGVTNELKVPNVLHFYAFSKPNQTFALSFRSFLGFMGGVRLSGAERVLIWCNKRPNGKYWTRFVDTVTRDGIGHRILLANTETATEIFGKKIGTIEHKVDVMKLQAAIVIGGIFFDGDTVTVRSMRPLRRYSCVIGREISTGLSIGAFLARPNSPFHLLWLTLYQLYHPNQWSQFSIILPHFLWSRWPNLCRVENKTMTWPSWLGDEAPLLYQDFKKLNSSWDWKQNFALHLWRGEDHHFQESKVDKANSAFGQLARRILYGDEKLRG